MYVPNIIKFFGTLLILLVLGGEESHAMKKYCGKALPEALMSICAGSYISKKLKKSTNFNFDNGLADYNNYNEFDDEQQEQQQVPYPYANLRYLAKIHGGSPYLMAKTRRIHEGIYDECCDKPCTIAELMSYCIPKARTYIDE